MKKLLSACLVVMFLLTACGTVRGDTACPYWTGLKGDCTFGAESYQKLKTYSLWISWDVGKITILDQQVKVTALPEQGINGELRDDHGTLITFPSVLKPGTYLFQKSDKLFGGFIIDSVDENSEFGISIDYYSQKEEGE